MSCDLTPKKKDRLSETFSKVLTYNTKRNNETHQAMNETNGQVETTETTQATGTSSVKGVKPAQTTVKHRDKRGKETFDIELSRIIVQEDFNKRTDESYGDIELLADQIEAMGQLESCFGHRNPDGTWTLTAGHRRYAALMLLSKRTKKEQFMRITRTDDKDTVTRLLVQYMENEKHAPSNYDKALIIGGLLKEGLKQKEIGQRLGIPQPLVSQLKALLDTPQDVQEAMRNKEISSVTVSKMLKELRNDGEALSKEVKATTAKAKAEGKAKATDRHSTVSGTRTIPTIVKDFTAKLEEKVAAEKELSDAEAFALAFMKKLATKPSDQALATFLRNYGK
jgi:ParB/RepB/Spo0J family partition protein